MLRQSVLSLKDKNNLAGNSQILLYKLKNYILFLIFALFFHFHQNLHKKTSPVWYFSASQENFPLKNYLFLIFKLKKKPITQTQTLTQIQTLNPDPDPDPNPNPNPFLLD
jgi:hypothetical protein